MKLESETNNVQYLSRVYISHRKDENLIQVLVGKSEEKRPFRRLSAGGRIILKTC
jgi:DNA repair exonuclease SbcCD ATPase subunit